MKIGLYRLSVCAVLLCSFVQAAPMRKKPVNVVLITIDTVRADHLGCYGDSNARTPTLDSLAHDGLAFDRAIAQVPLTWPSHAVILTGLYPFQNGVQDFTGQPLDARFQTVAQAFHRAGYTTGAVVSSFALDQSWGLRRGFDFYDDAFSAKSYNDRELGLVERRAQESVDHALAWLKKTQPRPFFLWLHLYDPHRPYDPPEPYASTFRSNPYDGEIAYADHELGRLITWLKSTKLYDRSLVVALSDHGESLAEHGEREHGFFVYNATVQVPLIVKPPAGSRLSPGRVAQPVETTAVAPTLLALAGVTDPIQKQFTSAGLVGKESASDSAYSETFYPLNSFGWSPLHALETSRYHYIDAPRPELYDLQTDPQEKQNLADQQAATVAVLRSKLQELQRKNPFTPSQGSASGLPADAAEKLRALGYVAYRSPVSAETLAAGLADPKDKIGDFNAILDALDALHAGDFPGGEALLAQVQAKDPKLYIVPFYLGEAALAQQKWSDASEQFQKCLTLNPNFDQAMTGLSRAQLFQNKPEEAKKWAQQALKFNPQNYKAWYMLGLIDARSDRALAISDYERAIALQGNFAPLQRDLGLLHFQNKDYARAAAYLSKAVELGTQDAVVFNSLGISYSRTGRPQKAVESYQQALALNSSFAEAHLNLASAYDRLGRSKLAEQELAAACKLEQKYCQ